MLSPNKNTGTEGYILRVTYSIKRQRGFRSDVPRVWLWVHT